MRRAAAIALLALGCAGADGAEGAEVWGAWGVELARTSVGACAYGITLEGDRFREVMLCTRIDEPIPHAQLTEGRAEFLGPQLMLTAEASSCPAMTSRLFEADLLGPDLLRLADASGVMVLERLDPSTAAPGVSLTGCFGGPQGFTEQPVRQLAAGDLGMIVVRGGQD